MRQTKTVSGSAVTHHAISSSASVEQEKYFAAVGRYHWHAKPSLACFQTEGNWAQVHVLCDY